MTRETINSLHRGFIGILLLTTVTTTLGLVEILVLYPDPSFLFE